jgi:hypothetical protein
MSSVDVSSKKINVQHAEQIFHTRVKCSLSALVVSCVPQKTHSQEAMTKVKYVLVPDVK